MTNKKLVSKGEVLKILEACKNENYIDEIDALIDALIDAQMKVLCLPTFSLEAIIEEMIEEWERTDNEIIYDIKRDIFLVCTYFLLFYGIPVIGWASIWLYYSDIGGLAFMFIWYMLTMTTILYSIFKK